MKKKLVIILLSMFLLTGINQARGQTATPPPPPGDNGGNGDSGGGAPIGSGLVLLLTMGAAYGGVKGYKFLITGKMRGDK